MPDISNLHKGSSTQRGGLNHQAIEDYLKTIYKLAQENSPVSTSRLADARDVKPASATGMIRRLSKLELANYEKHRGVTLTAEGERIALEVIRHHRLIELYLMRALGFTKDEVHDQADILEHVISEQLEERMAQMLGNPKFDPHGSPIPEKDGEVFIDTGVYLASAEIDSAVTVTAIKPSILLYCTERGITADTPLIVLDKEPMSGTLLVKTPTGTHLVNHQIAHGIEIIKSA